MKRDVIPVCSVHNRFQDNGGRWHDCGKDNEDLNEHAVYVCPQNWYELESPCDHCENEQYKLKL